MHLRKNRTKMRICMKMNSQDYRSQVLSFFMAALFYFNMDYCHAETNRNNNNNSNNNNNNHKQDDTQQHFSSSSAAEAFATAGSGVDIVEPYLEGFATTNVTAQIGTHAYLACRVKQLGNKSVSWIRVRDGHILTVDRAVFIADQRFLSLKQPDKFWTLQIKYVQARDAGAYECQVSTEPKVSARVHLQVVVPRTEILGDPDRYVKAGSTVVLRCIVRGALEPPTFIMWYHGAEQLATDSRRHRLQVDRNPPEVEGEAQSTIGSLIIEMAKKRDTGNYTCSPSNSPSVTVTLNVINGESSASAVTSSAPVTKAYTACILALICSVFLIGGHRT